MFVGPMESVPVSKGEKEVQHNLLLPAKEVEVLTELSKYFSSYSVDVLKVLNGRMNKNDFHNKYYQNTKRFPKELQGLVVAIHNYYLSSIEKIAPAKINNIEKKNNTLASTSNADCINDYCAAGGNDCFLLLPDQFCFHACIGNWHTWNC